MEFKLPDIGEGVTEGEITRWLVKPGDTLGIDQPMVEVMTDKATVELPSPVAGVVKNLSANEGDTVEVGKVIIQIEEEGGAAPSAPAPAATAPMPPPLSSASPAAAAAQAPAPAPVAKEEVIPFNVLATPATRKLARDLSVNLTQVKGTGPSGRVTKSDVQMYFESQKAAASPTPAPQPASVAVAPSPAATMPTVARGDIQRIPLRGLRKRISEAMSRSKHTAAHFTYVEEVDMTEIYQLRKSAKAEAESRNIKLTFLPFIIKAVIPALREFPYLNASMDDEKKEILLKGDYNIGIATDTPNGLIVPVVKACDQKSIWDIAEEISRLSDNARNGKSSVDELKGGTFTLTNAGSIGGVFATPVINHPEVAILGVNSIRKRPIVDESDQIVIRHMMYLSLSVDHRVVDGADAARFMNRLIYFLSDPKRFVFA